MLHAAHVARCTQVVRVSNPSVFSIGEVVVGVSAHDILKNMAVEELAHAPAEKDKVTRMLRHLLQQRSLYPLYPPPAGAQVVQPFLQHAMCRNAAHHAAAQRNMLRCGMRRAPLSCTRGPVPGPYGLLHRSGRDGPRSPGCSGSHWPQAQRIGTDSGTVPHRPRRVSRPYALCWHFAASLRCGNPRGFWAKPPMSMSRSDLFRSDPVLTAVSRWRALQLNLNDADDLILKVRPDIVLLPSAAQYGSVPTVSTAEYHAGAARHRRAADRSQTLREGSRWVRPAPPRLSPNPLR